MKQQITVDRIEGDLAVLEVGEVSVDWPLAALPDGIKEGDRLEVSWRICPAPSLQSAQDRLARLRAAAPEDDGEIDL